MKIAKLLIKNFKSFKSERINFPDLIAFIGENNAGKSNVLKALDLFFSDTSKLDEHFFNDSEEKIIIQVWFRDLSSEAKKTFSKYLLDDNETVIIRKEYSFDNGEKTIYATILGEKFDDDKDKKDAVEILDREEIAPFISQDKHYYWKPKPFGRTSVATAYMPDFLYVPAVKDAKEEMKVTDKSRFGQIINAMLGSVLENEELIKVNEEFSKLLMGENDNQEGRIAQLKEFENMLSEKISAHMKGTTIKLEVTPPSLKEVFQSGTKIIVDDGVSTAIENKGHGLQRSVIFVIFRAYADLLRNGGEGKSRALIFGIEEPELYLHPQMQRAMFAILKEIAKSDQVVFTTHSSFFVDMTQYQSVCVAVKKDVISGTKIIQYQGEIFSKTEEKKEFQLLTEFDPERNELFFGKKVILVEGDTEKVILPIVGQLVKPEYIFYDYGITIVECGGKGSIPFFIKVLNAFRIPYVVIYDKDSGNGDTNNKIEAEVMASGGIGYTEVIDSNFEGMCKAAGINIPAGRNKSFKAFKIFKELDAKNVPSRLTEIIEKLFT